MKRFKIKKIDIQAKEWFDKINGNSYFSANVTVNFGLPTQKGFHLPFQYGYDSHYIDTAGKELDKLGYISLIKYDNGGSYPLWRYCDDNKIILRTSKQTGCKKRDLAT